MSMTIELSAEMEARVRAIARSSGIDTSAVVTALIERGLAVTDAEEELTAQDMTGIEQAIDRGDADIAAGRLSSAEDVYTRMRAKYGVL